MWNLSGSHVRCKVFRFLPELLTIGSSNLTTVSIGYWIVRRESRFERNKMFELVLSLWGTLFHRTAHLLQYLMGYLIAGSVPDPLDLRFGCLFNISLSRSCTVVGLAINPQASKWSRVKPENRVYESARVPHSLPTTTDYHMRCNTLITRPLPSRLH